MLEMPDPSATVLLTALLASVTPGIRRHEHHNWLWAHHVRRNGSLGKSISTPISLEEAPAGIIARVRETNAGRIEIADAEAVVEAVVVDVVGCDLDGGAGGVARDVVQYAVHVREDLAGVVGLVAGVAELVAGLAFSLGCFSVGWLACGVHFVLDTTDAISKIGLLTRESWEGAAAVV